MNKEKIKVLNCGGAGYIFGYATDILLKKGYDVTVYDNLLYEDKYLKPVNFIYGDIRDTKKLTEVAKNFDIVILASALVGDSACSLQLDTTEQINYEAIKNFCDEIKYWKNKPFVIFTSTASVYGAQDGILDENSPTNPLSAYASTKLRAEKHIQEIGGCIFRLGTIMDLGDEFSRLRLDLIVNLLTMKATKGQELSVFGGDQWRPIISVRDIAEYVAEACERRPNDTFVLAKENVKIKDLAERIANIIPETTIKYTPMPFQDLRNYRVDTTKANNYFKYKPKVTVEEVVNRMKKIFKENRIKNTDLELYNNGFYLKKLKEYNNFV